MSSYLTFYFVPKAKKTKYLQNGETEEINITQEPLNFRSYSRNHPVYQAYYETLAIAYSGNEDKYTELTPEKANEVVNDFKISLEKSERNLRISYKILEKGGYNEDLYSDIQSSEEFIEEEHETLQELKFLADFITEALQSYSSIEKVLINID